MSDEFEEILDRNRDKLVRRIDLTHGLLNKLIERKVLQDEHRQDIESKATSQKQNETLLDILKLRGSRCFVIFREELARDQEELVKQCFPDNKDKIKKIFRIVRLVLELVLKSVCYIIYSIIFVSKEIYTISSGFLAKKQLESDISQCVEESKTEEDYRKCLESCIPILIDRLDAENGLIERLVQKKVLSTEEKQHLKLLSPYQKLNEELLDLILPRINDCYGDVVEALNETEQKHIVKCIEFEGIDVNEKECRPLTNEELKKIDGSLFCLIKLMDPNLSEFMNRLVSCSCITVRHMEKIEAIENLEKKNQELFRILRRRSVKDFENFKLCLCDTLQHNILSILEKGRIVPVIVNLSDKDKDDIESRVAKLLTGFAKREDMQNHLTSHQIEIINQILGALEKKGITLMGATIGNSVIIYLQCESSESILALNNFVDSGQLTTFIETIIGLIYPENKPSISIHADATIIKEYLIHPQQKHISSNLELSGNKTSSIRETTIQDLPIEIFELISLKTAAGEWVQFGKELPGMDRIKIAGYQGHIESLQIVIQRMLTMCGWSHEIYQRLTRPSFKRRLLRQINLKMICNGSTMLAEKLDLAHGLLDELKLRRVLTNDEELQVRKGKEEKKSVEIVQSIPVSTSGEEWTSLFDFDDEDEQEIEDIFSAVEFEYSQTKEPITLLETDAGKPGIGDVEKEEEKKFWKFLSPENDEKPRIIEVSRQWNERFLGFLRLKSHQELTKFLKVMEDSHQSHLLNYMISSGVYQESFKSNWPLDDNLTKNISANQEILITKMNPEKSLTRNLHQTEQRSDIESPEEINEELQKISDDSTQELEHDQGDLVSVLFSKHLITEQHSLEIRNAKYLREKNNLLIQLLLNGNRSVFETAVEYFTASDQKEVIEVLQPTFLINQLGKFQGEKRVRGVTWMNDRIYVVCREINRIFVFSGEKPFSELEAEETIVPRLDSPFDIVSCVAIASVVISDCSANRCVWKVGMPEGLISQFPVSGIPSNMSLSSSDELLVLTERNDNHYLTIINAVDFSHIKSIPMPSEVTKPTHVLKSSNENLIVLYKKRGSREVEYLISEMTIEGSFVRTFDLGSIQLDDPNHLAFDCCDNLFIADINNDQVITVDTRLNRAKVLLARYQHHIKLPSRLWYVKELQTLLVGQETYDNAGAFSIFSINQPQVG